MPFLGYPPEFPGINIDAEWTYRLQLPRATKGLVAMFAPIDRAGRVIAVQRIDNLIARLYRHHGPHGVLAKSWPTGSTAIWVAVMLSFMLLVYSI